MAKFDIPRFRYLAQEQDGDIILSIDMPRVIIGSGWFSDNYIYLNINGDINFNWKNTLIDLDKDDYDFEDGILRRIEK